ncbi:MAG: M48 family metallopeptidase, partial [Eubacteriales bacterium]
SEAEKDTVPFTAAELERMSEIALEKVTSRAGHFSAIMGVSYNKITVRRQVSRWGSCSSKKNLNFNCLLALVPDDVLDYVVVHELCHLKEMNHSEKFWREVERVIPDYKEKRKWLSDNGGELIRRLRIGDKP